MSKASDKQPETAGSHHPVYFVGAGPGDPELITVKGQRLLREADLVIFTGSLVPRTLLDGLKATIHDSAAMNLDEVFALILQAWQGGKRVVRLHTGDPSIYGAINEQIALLAQSCHPLLRGPGSQLRLGVGCGPQDRTDLAGGKPDGYLHQARRQDPGSGRGKP